MISQMAYWISPRIFSHFSENHGEHGNIRRHGGNIPEPTGASQASHPVEVGPCTPRHPTPGANGPLPKGASSASHPVEAGTRRPHNIIMGTQRGRSTSWSLVDRQLFFIALCYLVHLSFAKDVFMIHGRNAEVYDYIEHCQFGNKKFDMDNSDDVLALQNIPRDYRRNIYVTKHRDGRQTKMWLGDMSLEQFLGMLWVEQQAAADSRHSDTRPASAPIFGSNGMACRRRLADSSLTSVSFPETAGATGSWPMAGIALSILLVAIFLAVSVRKLRWKTNETPDGHNPAAPESISALSAKIRRSLAKGPLIAIPLSESAAASQAKLAPRASAMPAPGFVSGPAIHRRDRTQRSKSNDSRQPLGAELV